MARYGMLINTKKCIGCYACRMACQRQNDLLPMSRSSALKSVKWASTPT